MLATSGCGGGSEKDDSAQGVGREKAGSVAALAQCRDWRRGTVEERLATIEDIRGEAGEEGEEAQSALSDEEAYDLFERACANDFAQGFRLYKIYVRASAFQSLR